MLPVIRGLLLPACGRRHPYIQAAMSTSKTDNQQNQVSPIPFYFFMGSLVIGVLFLMGMLIFM